jgi:hypothetical protein
MDVTAAWGYEMQRRYGRNRERYEKIRPMNYEDKEEEPEELRSR